MIIQVEFDDGVSETYKIKNAPDRIIIYTKDKQLRATDERGKAVIPVKPVKPVKEKNVYDFW